jgi:hypothetical protein
MAEKIKITTKTDSKPLKLPVTKPAFPPKAPVFSEKGKKGNLKKIPGVK